MVQPREISCAMSDAEKFQCWFGNSFQGLHSLNGQSQNVSILLSMASVCVEIHRQEHNVIVRREIVRNESDDCCLALEFLNLTPVILSVRRKAY